MNNTSRTSVTPHVDKPKLSVVTPYSKKLHALISSHSVPQPRKFNFVKHRNMIAPGMFKINPSQTFRVDLVPNKQSSASIRTNPITNSQRHVTFKENVSSDTIIASSIGLVHTARTKRPQPKGITRNARVPSVSKSCDVKKNVAVEDHHRTLLLSKNQKTMSFECNNIKLAIRNDKSEIIFGTCKQCLVTANHDAYLLSSVNALNSRANNLCVNVPPSPNQKRHRTHVWKPKQVGFKEILAYTSKPRLPRFSLKCSPSGPSFDLNGKLAIVLQISTPSVSMTWPQLLLYVSWPVPLLLSSGYGINDYPTSTSTPSTNLPEMISSRVYQSLNMLKNIFVPLVSKEKAKEPLTHPNWFRIQSSGFICFIWICVVQCELQALMVNEVIKNFLKKIFVRFQAPIILIRTDNGTELKNHVLKEYIDSVGITHETSAAKTPQQNRVVERRNRTLVEAARTMLIFFHALLFLWAEAIATRMIMKISVNLVQKVILASSLDILLILFDELLAMAFEQNSSRIGLQNDYSRYTWVNFLRTKDETPEVIKNFLKKICVRLQAPIIIIRTDNGTELKNHVLKEYIDSVGITHETSAAKTPQQNRVVERRNRTLVEAARTMLIFSHALLFLWAEAIATTCYTLNCSIIHRRFNKTPYELIQGIKPDISYLHVFGALCYPKNDHEDIDKLGAKESSSSNCIYVHSRFFTGTDTPPRNRPLLATPKPRCEVRESSAAAVRRPGPTMAHRVNCSYVETRLRDTEKRMMAALELVNLRVSCHQVDVYTIESSEFCTRHHNAQKDHAAVRAEIEVLRSERLAYDYFQQYAQLTIPEFRDTLIQHMESVKKSIDERAQHKKEYDSGVNERQMQTIEEKVDTSKALDASLVDTESSGTDSKEQDTSSRSGNDAHDDDADIRPVYDEEPMDEVQTTAEINVIAIGQ
nr:putative ribonuclease H-like domain-containing protein [Tanacetum cinerariifolium]